VRMARLSLVLGIGVLMFAAAGSVHAAPILNVDSAPNVYGGGTGWDDWWTDAQDDVVAGTFVDMRSGVHGGALHPETGNVMMDPYDEIVYSTMDLGNRLHWIYWLPGETIAGLDGLFEVKWVIDYYGSEWTYEGGGWAANGAEVGWSQPVNWEYYDDGSGTTGVIGSLGFAWWATDNEADPLDSFGSVYDEVDQADIDALRLDVFDFQTFALGQVRYRESLTSDWQYVEPLQVDVAPVPEPASMALLGMGIFGLAVTRVRKKRNAG
jgi:PEP-CTERM motif